MFPHERSLVKRMANAPFALIGVNSDSDREDIKAKIKKEGLTWRSFWNGGGTQGPIATQWNVSGWPTLYVIDHEGIIRHKWTGSPGDEVLDRTLDHLVGKVVKQD